MRSLRPRITLRRMMVAIAAIAVALGAGVSPRWRTCSQEASYHASEERLFLRIANSYDARTSTPGNGLEAAASGAVAAAFRQQAANHARSRRRWERARWLPWTALPPIEPRRDSHGFPLR